VRYPERARTGTVLAAEVSAVSGDAPRAPVDAPASGVAVGDLSG
jgi:hypothetical protein